MKKIFVVVEGETEERFLRQVVYEHLIMQGIHIEPQQWFTNRKSGAKGGGKNFNHIENHINRLVAKYRHDKDVYISTMIDLYGFPLQGNSVYDAEVARQTSGKSKALLLQRKMEERIAHERFIPYVQLHEYEALLLAKPESFACFYTDMGENVERLSAEICHLNPEDINDTPEGAPSKRIIQYLPAYERQKTTAGVLVARHIGLPLLREKCLHFHEWITRLENC
jgi:hypothetical protein